MLDEGPLRRTARGCAGLALALAAGGCVSFTAAAAVTGEVQTSVARLDGAPAPQAASVPVALDDNRLFAQASFRQSDGRTRTVLAWVNMGMGGMTLAPDLRRAVGGGPVDLEIGGMPMRVDPKALLPADAGYFAQAFGPMPVEAVLPAEGLSLFRVTLDYAAKTVILARPTDAPAPGVAVPIEVSPKTGLISVQASIDGRTYPVVIDCGGGYTWLRGEVVRGWLAHHPDWYRADGAAGQSNQAMVGFAFEQGGTLARIPLVEIGPLRLRDVGVLGSSPAHGSPLDGLLDRAFWHGWGQAAPEPPIGWLGGNVLKRYRITIDYRNHVSYWAEVAPPEGDDLDAVGVSLVHRPDGYVVGGRVSRDGAAPVKDVLVGDRLVAVDGRSAAAMTRGQIIAALSGAPGELRRLTLERAGRTVEVTEPVTAWSAPLSPRVSMAAGAAGG